MENALMNAYCYALPRFADWKRANVVMAIVVAVFVLAALGMGVAAYCIYRGMSFDYAVSLSSWYIKIGCRR